jgi:polar amino acid transport system substrate-binding protein
MKKMVSILGIGVFIVTLLLTGCPAAEETEVPKIVVASDATWPPMEYIDEDGNMVGFDIDVMNAIAEAAGFEVEIRNTAWDGIFAGLATREYDAVISSVTITDERKETMDFSVPYINAGQVLIVHQNTTGVETLDDLAGEQVGAQIGTTGAFAVQEYPEIELATYDEVGLAVEDLYNQRIKGVVADNPVAADYVLQNERYAEALKIVGEPFTDEYYGIAVRKGNTEVLEMINTGLEQILADGTVDGFIDKWLR